MCTCHAQVFSEPMLFETFRPKLRLWSLWWCQSQITLAQPAVSPVPIFLIISGEKWTLICCEVLTSELELEVKGLGALKTQP